MPSNDSSSLYNFDLNCSPVAEKEEQKEEEEVIIKKTHDIVDDVIVEEDEQEASMPELYIHIY